MGAVMKITRAATSTAFGQKEGRIFLTASFFLDLPLTTIVSLKGCLSMELSIVSGSWLI